MKKIALLIGLGLGIFSCQNQQKIAFVDNGKVINDYQAKIDVEEKFKLKDLQFQKLRDSLIAKYQLEYKTAQDQAKGMSDNDVQKLSQELGMKEQQLIQQIKMKQEEMTEEFQKEIDSVIVEVKEFVKEYGKKNDYTYILGTSEVAASVLYGKEDNDLTQTITEALNKAYEEKE